MNRSRDHRVAETVNLAAENFNEEQIATEDLVILDLEPRGEAHAVGPRRLSP
jgi:hypothetical protein